MVGAVRFERPTPCAQGSEIGSRGYVGFREFLMVTTIRGICFRSNGKFIGWNGSGSDTVLAQRKSRGAIDGQAPELFAAGAEVVVLRDLQQIVRIDDFKPMVRESISPFPLNNCNPGPPNAGIRPAS